MLKRFLIVVLAMLLSGCGFHIRGQQDIPPQFKTTFIQNTNTKSDLTALLAANLQQLGVHLVASSVQTPVTIAILQDQFSQTSVALGTAQQLNNVTLMYTVTVVLRDRAGNNLLSPVTLTSSATDLQNANQVLGDITALPQIQQMLIVDVVQKILSYLNAKQTRAVLAHVSV